MVTPDDRGVPFERTTCACAADVVNCHRQPGYLGLGDAARIVEHMVGAQESDAAVVNAAAVFFRRGCATVACSTTGRTATIATIVPVKEGGRCIFLDATERCTIHAIAPYGCAYFDVHQSRREADRRSVWMLRQLATNADYRRLAESLPPKEARSVRTSC